MEKSRNKTCFKKKFSTTLRTNKSTRAFFHISVIIEKGYCRGPDKYIMSLYTAQCRAV